MHEYEAEQPNKSSPVPQTMQFLITGSEFERAPMPPLFGTIGSSTTIVQFVIVGKDSSRSIPPVAYVDQLFDRTQL